MGSSKHGNFKVEGEYDYNTGTYNYAHQPQQPQQSKQLNVAGEEKKAAPRRKEYDSTGGSIVVAREYPRDSSEVNHYQAGSKPKATVFLAESGDQRDPSRFIGEYNYTGKQDA